MWNRLKFITWLFLDDIRLDLKAIWADIRPMRNK